MKETAVKARSPSGWASKLARRTVLSGFGAAGLTAATAVFGRQLAVASPACCNLAFAPSGYQACMDGRHYAWTCQWTSGRHCVCCERQRTNGSYYASAYKCS
jgi:hypothetical protein